MKLYNFLYFNNGSITIDEETAFSSFSSTDYSDFDSSASDISTTSSVLEERTDSMESEETTNW